MPKSTKMDPSVAEIVAMGYSEAQAKQALADNNGDVDDAIDDLFLKGRLKARNASTNPVFDPEDVTVTDSLHTSATVVSHRATPAIPLMAMRGSNNNVQASANRRGSGPTQDTTTDDAISPTARPSSARNLSSRASAKPPPAASAQQQTPPIHEEKVWPSKKAPAPVPKPTQEAKPLSSKKMSKKGLAGIDDEISAKSSQGQSAARQSGRQSGRQSSPVAPVAAGAAMVTPGAYAVGTDHLNDQQGHDDVVTSTTAQPSAGLQNITTAELVDPDQENQILEQRLQEELERERGRAAVAQVVDEDELKTCHWKRVAVVIGVVVIACAIALGVALTRPPPETPAPTLAPTRAPPPQEIIDLIAPVSYDNGTSLYDPDSPQSEAARWLATSANLADYPDERKLQRYALATLYFSTNGDEWGDSQDWLSDNDECLWFPNFEINGDSVIECDSNGMLTYLETQKNNLVGTIPDEIAFLSTAMVELKLNENDIQGSLPSTIGEMTRLQYLELHENNFSKPIPTEYGQLTQLEEFLVYKNGLTGTLPSEMALMTSLAYLRVEENKFNGTISPTLISSWLRLEERLAMSENSFTGTIPTEIGLLTLLKEIEVDDNLLTGGLPTEIGLMTSLEDAIKVNENFLTGPLPTELGLLTGLSDELRLGENVFTGSIPTEFAVLTDLVRLGLGDNNLTGTIPSFIGTFGDLDHLELQNNTFTGSIPAELGVLTKMTELKLGTNNITGTILSEFTQFPDLEEFAIQNNSLTGTIPPFGNLVKLKELLAGWNMLTGSIPETIANLTNLERLELSNNVLTGTIPQAIFELPLIETIHLYNNSFVGSATCPPSIDDCLLSCAIPGNESCRTLSS